MAKKEMMKDLQEIKSFREILSYLFTEGPEGSAKCFKNSEWVPVWEKLAEEFNQKVGEEKIIINKRKSLIWQEQIMLLSVRLIEWEQHNSKRVIRWKPKKSMNEVSVTFKLLEEIYTNIEIYFGIFGTEAVLKIVKKPESVLNSSIPDKLSDKFKDIQERIDNYMNSNDCHVSDRSIIPEFTKAAKTSEKEPIEIYNSEEPIETHSSEEDKPIETYSSEEEPVETYNSEESIETYNPEEEEPIETYNPEEEVVTGLRVLGKNPKISETKFNYVDDVPTEIQEKIREQNECALKLPGYKDVLVVSRHPINMGLVQSLKEKFGDIRLHMRIAREGSRFNDIAEIVQYVKDYKIVAVYAILPQQSMQLLRAILSKDITLLKPRYTKTSATVPLVNVSLKTSAATEVFIDGVEEIQAIELVTSSWS